MKPRLSFPLGASLLAAAVFGAAACGAADFSKTRTTAAPVAPSTTPPAPAEVTINPSSFDGRLLAAHNGERKRMRIAALAWSPQLAAQASVWARHLASKGLFEHSTNRGSIGENLWMGTSGYYTPEQMTGSFILERQYFRAGKFPDVSTTGKWADVGHYTQLIWPDTQLLGCAKATGAGKDVLVCRYFPAGNVMGQRVP